MKKILIDARFAASPLGLGRYVRELVSRLVASECAQFDILVSGTTHDWFGQHAGHCHLIEVDIPHYSLAEQRKMPGIIKQAGPDVLFVPHFNAPLFARVPTVITVHDLILHQYPNEASLLKQMMYRTLIGTAVRRARSVISVSHFVREELRTHYGPAVTRKTVVIPEGVSEHFTLWSDAACASVLARHDIASAFFLYVGSAKEHKNVPLLIRAFAEAHLQDASLVLVIGRREAQKLSPLPRNVRILSDVPEADLPALYSAARAFVTASLYEGYGLPIAEALACGCPVIATDCTAIPEVAAGHAVLLDPEMAQFSQAFSHPPVRGLPFRTGGWNDAVRRTLEVLVAASQ